MTPILAAARTGEADGWLLTSKGLSRTTDGGQSWQRFAVSGLDLALFRPGEFFVDGDSAWVATSARGDGTVAVTAVHGESSFTGILPERYPGVRAVPIDFLDSRRGWVAVGAPQGASSPGADLYATGDGGRSWHLVVRGTPVSQALHFVDSHIGWALGGSTLYRSRDGGRSWQPRHPPAPCVTGLGCNYPAVSFFGPTGVLQVNVPTGLQAFAVFDVTHDGGGSWVTRRPPGEAGFSGTGPPLSLAASDGAHWHIASGSRVWRTDDSGSTWTPVSGASAPHADAARQLVLGLSFPTPGEGWATVADSSQPCTSTSPFIACNLLATNDGGVTPVAVGVHSRCRKAHMIWVVEQR